jgi:phosphoribosyl-AMP cyclohydrolase
MDREYTNTLLLDFGPNGDHLLPVISQDLVSKTILIVSYTNQAAFEATRRSGLATFYSRSRQEIWQKGATSGNFLKVEEILVNCEQNSLVYLVTPLQGGACHAQRLDGQAYFGCYYRRVKADGSLEFI